MWRSLVEWLGSNYRITIPQAPSDGADRSEWLRGFIEGLGLSAFILVASAEFCGAALDLATADELTVDKLVLLPDPTSRELWIAPGWTPAEARQRIETFLSTEE